MSSRFHRITRVAAIVAMLALSSASQALAQSDDDDPEMRIQQLENQLRQLTGQNEELQYRNRQLEERLRLLQGGAQAAPGGQPAGRPAQRRRGASDAARSGLPAAAGPAGLRPADRGSGADRPGAGRRAASARPAPRRCLRSQPESECPGAPRALGGGQLPIPAEAPVGAPGGRGAGEPLDLGTPTSPIRRTATGARCRRTLTTLPPSATPKDEFDLGIGYMQRKDYALAEETMRNFAQKYPSDPLMADSQYWLGESFFQRQQYRDAAEAFLAVTTKFDKSAKAPDALLRLGQSLAALKEKEAACAALRRGDAEISARLERRQSGRGPRAKAG